MMARSGHSHLASSTMDFSSTDITTVALCVSSQVLDHKLRPKLKDQGHNNVLCGEGCHTPQRAVTDEY
jgi:hypothetical protein